MHGSPNLVYINVSPIEYGHVLLVPRGHGLPAPGAGRWQWQTRVKLLLAPTIWHQSAAICGLLCQRHLRCAPVPSSSHAAVQVVCPGSLLLALNFLKQVNNAYFRIGFNSLGAYGTINHLHFQVVLRTLPAVLAVIWQAMAQIGSACQLASVM